MIKQFSLINPNTEPDHRLGTKSHLCKFHFHYQKELLDI